MKNIIIYSSKNCHYCQEAKNYFKEHNIPYTEYDVVENLERRKEMTDLTGARSIPVIVAGKNYQLGWNVEEFNKLIKYHEEQI